MKWYETIFGDWRIDESSIAARLCEDYVNSDREASWLDAAFDKMIAKYGRRVFA